MSTAQALEPPPPLKGAGGAQKQHPAKAAGGGSKRKNKHDRGGRKRSKSFSGGGGLMISQKPVLPTKFLLGGNIKDPLNLNSLQDEEINRAMNAVTPKSSPVPTPPRKKGQIEVIIPRNIHDPLNLIDCADDAEYEQQLCSTIKKSKKKRLKKRRTFSGTSEAAAEPADVSVPSEAKTPEPSTDSAKIPDDAPPPNADGGVATPTTDGVTTPKAVKRKVSTTVDGATPPKTGKRKVAPTTDAVVTPPNKAGKRKAPPKPKAVHELSLEVGVPSKKEGQKKSKNTGMDKIVSPVVPQPGAWLKRSTSINNKRGKPPNRQNRAEGGEVAKEPHFKDKDQRFQYGNYNRYYGYRNPNNEIDHRLRVFSHHPYLFANKDILDIGCNIGHVTHSVARDFRAKTVLGIDIDPKLISIARKNIRHYVKTEESPVTEEGGQTGSKQSSEFFPISMPILYGAIDVPGDSDGERKKGSGFPNNVTFKHCNYILEDDNLIALEQPQFDVILCLSISKWIHLNWGDAGIKQAFRRMYAQLRPGGKLILEPQNWASYKKKKKLTATIYKHFSSIEFFPDKFREYLLSPAVGFAKGEILGYPSHQAKGFRRPIQVFTKSTMFPSERVEATPVSFTPGGGVASADSLSSKAGKYESQNCVSHVYTNIFDDRFCDVSDDNAGSNERLKERSKDPLGPAHSERTVGSSEDADDLRTGEGRMEVDGEVREGGERETTPDNT